MTNKNTTDEEFDKDLALYEFLKIYFDAKNKNKDKEFDENVTLYELLKMYFDNFANHSYNYKLRFDDSSIKIFFEVEHMISLLGLHHFEYYGENNQNEELFYKLINEEVTFELLKETNSQIYKKNLKRMQYFQFLKDLMNCGKFVKPALSRDKKNIDFFIFLIIQNRNIYLGIKKEKNTNTYYPVTFIEDDKKQFEHLEFLHSDGSPIKATKTGTHFRVY